MKGFVVLRILLPQKWLQNPGFSTRASTRDSLLRPKSFTLGAEDSFQTGMASVVDGVYACLQICIQIFMLCTSNLFTYYLNIEYIHES